MKKVVKIGNAGGFWGDDLNALKRQLEGGGLDYISIDFLAEITMSILKKQQLKNPQAGYVKDFADQVITNAGLIQSKKVRIITNAGGMNPAGCAKQITENLKKQGIQLKIAIVEGDDITDQISKYYPGLTDFKNLETGSSFEEIREHVQSANVYLGVIPIIKALETGADIIIAGRVTDTAITMAPAIHEFGWKINDWDKIASVLVAGHIIECGAQSTGGNFTDWELVQNWVPMGYPCIEVSPDGSFVVTKHRDTGGLVTVDSVKEQLVYEMGDPSCYISPDVVADFRTIKLEQQGTDRVYVSGVKGFPSTPFYKVSMAYADGYKATSSIIISGEKAMEKAKKFAEIFWQRLNIIFKKQNTEFTGYNSCHQGLAPEIVPNEILLRFSVYDYDRSKIEEFSKQIAPLILSGPPGVAVTGGRPPVQEVMTYYPTLIPKELVNPQISVTDQEGNPSVSIEISSVTGFEQAFVAQTPVLTDSTQYRMPGDKTFKKVKLRELCLARSGDKGDTSNIGVIARSKEIYEFLKQRLTAGYIKDLFSGICKGKVTRYELDNLLALNFLLEESLDGGGTKSLMIDAQGKTFASALLNQEIGIPTGLADNLVLFHK